MSTLHGHQLLVA